MRKHWGIFLVAFFLCVGLSACGEKSVAPKPPATGLLENTGSEIISLDIKPWPARTGSASLAVRVTGKDGKPVANASVSVVFSMPGMSMKGPTANLASGAEAGVYDGKTDFSMATDWQADVSVKAESQEEQSASFRFTVAY